MSMPELVGLAGFVTGECSGKVKVVRTLDDLSKVEHGDILVAETTDPNYDVAFERSCAVIVEKGNVFSHAVMATRDLMARKGIKVLVLVGVKDATKKLEDGMSATIKIPQVTRPGKIIY